MKPEHSSPRKAGAERRKRSSTGVPHLPMEWMDPMSWRLPSGKALAEFALQAGFLVPRIMSTPKVQKGAGPMDPAMAKKRAEEVPERSGSFRETR
jgi:hypothetical protein